eukprot:TRINITY_DN107223_c0_g1_i1.p1 TRINITY_DN107223_c0_g1~~TRINITY_DN107223_c0_g1_i1.p1  ORF type:complete len:230 (+),score=69.06 TRINITY_DN107223_c0_g1_i1:29-691(+)
MSLGDLLPDISTALRAGPVSQDTSLWTKLSRVCTKAKKSPDVLDGVDDQGFLDTVEFLLRFSDEKASFRKQVFAALLALVSSAAGRSAFVTAPGKSRLQLWKLPIATKGDGSMGAVELAQDLISAGCAPDDFLAPPEEVLESASFARELLKLVGEIESFKASDVGKVLLAAELPAELEEEKPKRQVVGGASAFNAKSTAVVQVEVVNGMAKASQASGVKF